MRLNLGCGPNVFEGWTNVDIEDVDQTFLSHMRSAHSFEGWPEWQKQIGNALKQGSGFRLHQCDFVKDDWPKPWDTWKNYADAIYIGQAIEHLNPVHELPTVLRKCHQVLKPGGVLRITTPDFALILQEFDSGNMGSFAQEQPGYYEKANPYDQLSYLLFGATGPNCTRSNYEGHFHIYTKETLASRVSAAGFSQIDFPWPSTRLPDVRDFGRSHSFALEAIKA